MDKKVKHAIKQANNKLDLCEKSADSTYKVAMQAIKELQKMAVQLQRINELLVT